MANVIVAVGAVLAVLGSWAVYFGYTIVQIERGWATMIAGAVVASGGVITTALGLVLRRLIAIQATLQPRETMRLEPAAVESKEASPQLEFALVPPVSQPTDRMNEPVLSPPVPHLADLPLATHAHPDEARQDLSALSAPEADGVDHAWHAVHAELQRTDWAAPAHTPDATPAPPLAAEIVPHEPEHVFADHPDTEPVEAHIATPLVAEPEPEPEPAPPPPLAFEHKPAPAAHAPAAAEFEDDFGDLLGHAKSEPALASHAHAPDPAPEHPEAPVAPPHSASTRHVIGTYDADGTTYTMYSDGSIEAHAPEGVYQFGSMAELKAFIEQGPS